MREKTTARRPLRAMAVSAVAAAGATGLVLAVSSPAQDPPASGGGDRAKNVILIQGDGMGTAQRDLIRLATVGPDDELAMDSLRHTGLVHTDAEDPDDVVTDSAAAATAYASGVRTYNGAVGVDVDKRPVPSLLDQARAAGKATGIVTTSQVTDASPAAFGAHVPDRADQSEIARQFLDHSKPDVILGGGEDWWLPAGTPGSWPDAPPKDPTEQSKGTKGDLIARAVELGYDHVSDRAGLRATRSRKILGLFDNEEMFEHRPEGEGDLYEPVVPLPVMTRKALDVLSRDRDGFFLFVEEEGIDEFAHSNNAEKTIKSGQALDETVAVVLRFVAAHPDTLVAVVGDHETGGLTIENAEDADDETGTAPSTEDGPFPVAGTDLEMVVDWTSDGHTGADTPVTASGPGASALGHTILNTGVHDALLDAMELED
jgi:alkaline phosphatase